MNTEYEYDAFISYEWDAKPLVVPFYRKLCDYNLNVFMDELGIQQNQVRIKSKVTAALKSTKLFICCLTKGYCSVANTGDLNSQEILYAHQLKIPFVVLIFEHVNLIKIASLGLLIRDCVKYNLYKTPEILIDWNGPIFLKIMEDIKTFHKQKNRTRSLDSKKLMNTILVLDMF